MRSEVPQASAPVTSFAALPGFQLRASEAAGHNLVGRALAQTCLACPLASLVA